MSDQASEPNAQNEPMRESHMRSIIKGFSWRILATLITGVVTFFATGKLDVAFKVMSVEFPAKIFIYYIHERVWQMVPRGTVRRFLPFLNKDSSASSK